MPALYPVVFLLHPAALHERAAGSASHSSQSQPLTCRLKLPIDKIVPVERRPLIRAKHQCVGTHEQGQAWHGIEFLDNNLARYRD